LVGDDLLGAWFGSIADRGCFLTPAEIAEVNALPYTSEERKLGLLCGIGLHNAVVKESRQYRSMVEKLFQNKKLLFVFATTSLSYGINMPCSKVVFLGDSPHLTNMVFRQSSGRAGRRGHMSGAGNIYFVGFTQLSIIRKLCTPIDSLTPRQAVSPAYILKLTSVNATCHPNNNKWVDHMTLQGLVNPLFERLLEGKDVIRTQFRTALLNSVHFSWSFLAERGKPHNC
jgi:replicative superfamily II helicase